MEMSTAAAYARQRRPGISAAAVTQERLENWVPPSFPKQGKERGQIWDAISNMKVLFGHLNSADRSKVVDAMVRVEVPAGTDLIKQGDEGDNFYIVDSGEFEFRVARDGGEPEAVGIAAAGTAFGELALMYNSPRAATVRALIDSVCWALDRDTFQLMLVTAENTKKRTYEDFLEHITIFKGLNKYERVQLSDMLTPKIFRPGECIVRQGDLGDQFYILEEGEAVCLKTDDKGKEALQCRYCRGGYFGELALIGEGTRKASVYAVSRCRTLWIDRPTFDRVLGPLRETFLKQYDGCYADICESARVRSRQHHSNAADRPMKTSRW